MNISKSVALSLTIHLEDNDDLFKRQYDGIRTLFNDKYHIQNFDVTLAFLYI